MARGAVPALLAALAALLAVAPPAPAADAAGVRDTAGVRAEAAGVRTAAAQAESGYRYWSFWERKDGAWAYASQGPSFLRPDDGSVLGFRFAVSEDSAEATKPRGAAGFGTICADTEPEPGSKRVALVVDFGTAADAPAGETPPKSRTACARIGEDGSAGDALAAEAKPLRYNSDALLCAIAGYPESGCGEQISGKRKGGSDGGAESGREDAAEGDADGGMPAGLGIAAGAGAVLVLGAAAFWQTRRRRG
ncbi:SCO2322 family protein [Streptomyces armeniacus]|uniref:SCO2322 family protein n=1 Tax=Streptomyces armeniacus TaxID=83291 RepID=UPI003CCC6F53